MLACHAEYHGFKSRSIRNFIYKKIKKFRKNLKKIKTIIKLNTNFIFFNFFFKKKKFFKSNLIFIYIYKNYKKNNIVKLKNFSVLYFLNNLGNISSCIRTCFIFNVISLVNIKLKFKLNFFLENVLFIKNIKKIIIFLKKNKILLSFSIKSKTNIKKIFLKQKFIILIGNEKKGLKFFFFKKSDLIIKIKSYCKISLNVNVVNGIILFYLKNDL